MQGRGFGGEQRFDEVPSALGDVGWNPETGQAVIAEETTGKSGRA